jgi:3'-5' exoribonuclease
MILTHHYEPEFGSPKKPLIPEGELLHYLDMIDARMYDMNKALKDTIAEQFTDPIFVLDRRKLYKSKYGITED